MKKCLHCQLDFVVSENDRDFLQRFDVQDLNLCPDCRFRNRIAFRNEQRFYRRTCDMCKKPSISVYSEDKSFKVYCSDCWWSDKYDPLEYGRVFQENQSIFEQIHELAKVVPKPAIMNMKSENCDYTNYSSENKNCYVVVGAAFCEDSYYSYRVFSCKDIIDCYDVQKSEICYECTHSRNLYNCLFCDSCDDCSDLIYCNDCIGCHNCFGCVNLRNKEFYIFNKKYSEEEYHTKVKDLKKDLSSAKKEYEKLKLSLPQKASHIINCENCTGDQLSNDKNCVSCFALHNSEECVNIINGDRDKYSFDACFSDGSELLFNTMSCDTNYNIFVANLVWYSQDSYYVTNCFSSSNLFGCVGMKKHKYCILNKQYSKDEYEALIKKIIKQMKDTGEWGRYFPIEMSPFAYNESIAQEYFPMEKAEVLNQGLNWKDDLDEVREDIPGTAVKCVITGKPFKLIPQELKLYERMGIEPPKVHPFERHLIRTRNTRKYRLYNRNCDKCNTSIETTFTPDQKEIVYCEKCFLKAVY